MWGRVWRWTLTVVVVFSGYFFLSISALRGVDGSAYDFDVVLWMFFAFVLIGPIAIGMAVYSLIDDHKRRRRKELAHSLRPYLERTYPNGYQRLGAAGLLVRRLSIVLEWIGPDTEFNDEIFASTSIEPPRYVHGEYEPRDGFLHLGGIRDVAEYVPCSLSTATIGVAEIAPEWAMAVKAFGQPDYEFGDPIVTIGELAVSARDRLHDGILYHVESDRYGLQRHVWAHLLSDTCEVVLPEKAARRLGLPSGSTFGFATRACAWNLKGLAYE